MRIERATRLFLGVALLAAIGGCGDETTEPPGRRPHAVNIPTDMSLSEAAMDAVPGDTLIFVSTVFLFEPVVFQSSQTPLLLVSGKGVGGVSSAGADTLLHFLSPRAGTTISQLSFGGGDPGILAEGGGSLLIEACSFAGGSVQVLARGGGLNVTVNGCFMENASAFSIETAQGAATTATANTIVHAGDCGIYLGGGSSVVSNCIIWQSAAYAIACQGGSLAEGSGCNDLFGSGAAEYLNCTPPETDISLDPLFCDAPSGEYTLRVDSPCSPANSIPGCGLVGAFDATCPPPGTAGP